MILHNKIAVITGGASGIGRATALLFAREGAAVVVADLNDAAANTVVEEIARSGGRASFQHTDVTDVADCQKLVARTIAEFGKIDILFNNAGIIRRASITELSEDQLGPGHGRERKVYLPAFA